MGRRGALCGGACKNCLSLNSGINELCECFVLVSGIRKAAAALVDYSMEFRPCFSI